MATSERDRVDVTESGDDTWRREVGREGLVGVRVFLGGRAPTGDGVVVANRAAAPLVEGDGEDRGWS